MLQKAAVPASTSWERSLGLDGTRGMDHTEVLDAANLLLYMFETAESGCEKYGRVYPYMYVHTDDTRASQDEA